MKRFLAALVIFGLAVFLLRRLAWILQGGEAREPGRREEAGRAGAAARRGDGVTELVRDRICNTYLPRDRALALRESGRVHYFCSEQCRTRHLAGPARDVGLAQRA